MNILIKLMSIVSLVIAPTLATLHGTATTTANAHCKMEGKMQKECMMALEGLSEAEMKDKCEKMGCNYEDCKKQLLEMKEEKEMCEAHKLPGGNEEGTLIITKKVMIDKDGKRTEKTDTVVGKK